MLKLMLLQIDSFGALPVIVFAVLAVIIVFVALTKDIKDVLQTEF
jgi:uncharacterized membrane protein